MKRRVWLGMVIGGGVGLVGAGCSTALSTVDGTRHLWHNGWDEPPIPPTPKGFTVRVEEVVDVVNTSRTKDRQQLFADRRYYYIVGDFQKLTGANSWIARTRGTRIDGRDRAAFEAWAAGARRERLGITPQRLQTPARSTSS
jgi:hypothetical protein